MFWLYSYYIKILSPKMKALNKLHMNPWSQKSYQQFDIQPISQQHINIPFTSWQPCIFSSPKYILLFSHKIRIYFWKKKNVESWHFTAKYYFFGKNRKFTQLLGAKRIFFRKNWEHFSIYFLYIFVLRKHCKSNKKQCYKKLELEVIKKLSS